MSEILMEFKKGFLAVRSIINIFHDIRDRTMEQPAQLVYCICADAIAFFDGMICCF